MSEIWRMITLIPKRGKEDEAKGVLKRAIKMEKLKGAVIVSGGAKKEHYHILGESIDFEKCGLEKWPGTIKKDFITESQAIVMGRTHSQYAIQ